MGEIPYCPPLLWLVCQNYYYHKGEGIFYSHIVKVSLFLRYQEFGVHPITVGHWKKELQEQAKTLFEGKRGPTAIAAHREPEVLYSEIGKLKVELDWLKKKSGINR